MGIYSYYFTCMGSLIFLLQLHRREINCDTVLGLDSVRIRSISGHFLKCAVTLILFEHTSVVYWMHTSIRVFTYGFSPTAIHHVTVENCLNGCPKIILDAGLVAVVTLQFPGLHAHLA
jgi:hypothetical protein